MRRPQTAMLLALVGLGLTLAPTSAAAPRSDRSVRKKGIGSCPAFHQTRMGNEGLRFDLHNTCGFPVACALTWSVHCRGPAESPGERTETLTLAVGASDSVVASGAACGADGWDIDDIHWSCDPRPADHGKPPAPDGEL